jgi:hypothetical protein
VKEVAAEMLIAEFGVAVRVDVEVFVDVGDQRVAYFVHSHRVFPSK